MKKIMITFFMVTSVWGVGASVLVKSALMQKRSMTETVLCYGQVAPPANKM